MQFVDIIIIIIIITPPRQQRSDAYKIHKNHNT